MEKGKGDKVISDFMALSDVNGLLKIVSFLGVGHGKLLSILGYRCPTCLLILGIGSCVFGSKMLCYN